MNCNSCNQARTLNFCSDSISIGTFLPDTNYYVYVQNTANSNIIRFEATSDADGLLIITTTDFEFSTQSDYKLWVTLETATNQHDNVLFDVSDGEEIVEDVPCLLLKFEKVVDKDSCCKCLDEQTILLEQSVVPADSPCVCVTQEMIDAWDAAIGGALATVNLVNQQAAIAQTSLFTPTVDGFYQVSWYASVTRVSSNTGTLGGTQGFRLYATDADTNVNKTSLEANNIAGFGQTGDGTTNNQLISGVINCWAKAGQPIEYSFDYLSDGGGLDEMQYNLHIVLRKL